MKKTNKKKGFTLIELIIVLGIVGIAITSVFALLIFGRNVFQGGNLQKNLQASNRAFADFIERELSYANNVEILEEVPVNFDTDKRYIYVEEGKMMHKKEDENPKMLRELEMTSDNSVEFDRISNTTFSYEIENKMKTQKYKISSEIDVLNLKGEKIEERIKGEEGKVLCYSFSSSSKELIFFNFDEEKNDVLSKDVEGRILNDEVILYVPREAMDVELYANFDHTGARAYIKNEEQEANEKRYKFGDENNQLKIKIEARDGSTKEYLIRVVSLDSVPVVQNVRIIPKNPGPGSEDTWEITPMAWHTSHLFLNNYNFISNGNGEDASEFQWYISDTEDGEYKKIPGERDRKYEPGLKDIDKWIKVEVTPKGTNGIEGTPVLSEGVQINKDPGNALWKRIVEDVHFEYMSKLDQEKFNKDRKDNNLDPYNVIVKIRGDLPRDSESKFKVTTDLEKLSLQIEGTGDFPPKGRGGSFVSIDLTEYILDEYKFRDRDENINMTKFLENMNGYQVTVDARVIKGPGWGVMLNGTVSEEPEEGKDDGTLSNRDFGYMFQFDPGYKPESEGGFVVRRNIDGRHDKSGMQFDGLGVEYGRQSQSYYSHKDLINDKFKIGRLDGWQGYLKDYTTEITVQIQRDNSMIMRVRVWRKGHPDKISNEMWFGDFGTHEIKDADQKNKIFKGISPKGQDRKPTENNSSDYRGLVRLGRHENMTENEKKNGWDWGTMLGFRTWGSEYEVQYNDISVHEGFSMKLESAKWIVEDKNDINEKTNKILLEFDQELREDDFREEGYMDFKSLGRIENISVITIPDREVENSGVIITFDKDVSANSIIKNNKLKRGAVRHVKAGDIEIKNGNNFEVKGKVESSDFTPKFDENKYYKIVNSKSLENLDVRNGSEENNAEIMTFTEFNPINANQEWRIMETKDGYYTIKSKKSKKNVYNNRNNSNIKDHIIQRNPKEEDEQKWLIEKSGKAYIIRSKKDKRKIQPSDKNHRKLIMGEQNSYVNNEQIWQIIETSDVE